jgi:hypothetical protein
MAKRKGKGLTGFSLAVQKPRKRGRPTRLDDLSLQNRRDGFLQILEWHWGELGWELPRCKQPEDVRRAFEFLSGKLFHEMITLFCHPSRESGLRTETSEVRRQLASLTPKLRKAYEASREAHERLQRIRAALAQAGSQAPGRLRGELRVREKKTQEAERFHESLSGINQELSDRLGDCEAYYARKEMCDFIASKRYEINPLNLANAAAGLPFMGWRQSMKRCRRGKPVVANGLSYQVFKIIRYLYSTAKTKNALGLVAHFKENLPALSKKHERPRQELAEHWFFLERAIREGSQASRIEAIPFEISKRYFRSVQSQSAMDVVIAEESRLPLR